MSKNALPRQADDFPAWYAEIIRRAELAEHGPVRGTMVIRPYGTAIWERLQRALGRVLEDPDSLAPAAPPKRKVKAMWAMMSAALPLVRILLPHLAAALGPRRR